MHVLTNGCTRTVILIGGWAIKIPTFKTWGLFLYGLLSNMQERMFWTTKWPELCPILFSIPGGWLVVMRRARPLTDHEWDNLHFGRHTNEYSGGRIIPVEPKRCSFGVVDGRIVAVDYGACGPSLRVDLDVSRGDYVKAQAPPGPGPTEEAAPTGLCACVGMPTLLPGRAETLDPLLLVWRPQA